VRTSSSAIHLGASRRSRAPWLIAAAITFGLPPAHAHDTWLAHANATDDDRSALSLRLTTGDRFPRLEGGTAVARVARAECIFDSRREALQIGLPSAHALPVQCRWAHDAAAVAILSLHPRDLELDAESVAVYLGELGNDPRIAERHAGLGRWRERYRKNAKAIVRHAPGEPLAAAVLPHGLDFELVPDTDPTLLPEGGALRVCAYASGVAVGPIYLGLVEANGRASWRWSDAAGCVEVKPERRGYLLRSIRLLPAKLADLEWESEFASLTVYSPEKAP